MHDCEFQPHPIEWTRERSQHFWDHYAAHTPIEQYFSYQVGDRVIDIVGQHVGLDGEILDFGCGPGLLLEKLAQRGLSVTGLDFSEDSIELAAERTTGMSSVRELILASGLPSELRPSTFSTVFLLETIEHLVPADLDATFAEIHRLLGDGGHVVITTPNDEDLLRHEVLCPECGAMFHAVQHVSSWSADSLSKYLVAHSFVPIFVLTTDLTWSAPTERPRNPFKQRPPVVPPPATNLMAIAQKRA